MVKEGRMDYEYLHNTHDTRRLTNASLQPRKTGARNLLKTEHSLERRSPEPSAGRRMPEPTLNHTHLRRQESLPAPAPTGGKRRNYRDAIANKTVKAPLTTELAPQPERRRPKAPELAPV